MPPSRDLTPLDMRAILDRLGVDDLRVAPLLASPAQLTELSINAQVDPRGALRVSIFDRDAALIDAALAAAPALQRTHRACPGEDACGAGLVVASPRMRWWRFGHGRGDAALGRWARQAWGHHAAALDWLAPDDRLTAVGAEGADSVWRTTIYAPLTGDREAAILRRAGLRAGPRAAAFGVLRDLMPHATVWIGHSLGRGAGLKLYLFLRAYMRRLSDAEVLDVIAAPRRVRAAVDAFERAAVIQLVGLTWPSDGQPPRWTLYLADA